MTASCPFQGQRAVVVVGGSLAGLLAARALAAHYDEVQVLDRALFEATPAPRMSTPQSCHLHVLLKGGENAMERMVPGFREALERSGSVRMNPGTDFHCASELGVARAFESAMVVHGQSR